MTIMIPTWQRQVLAKVQAQRCTQNRGMASCECSGPETPGRHNMTLKACPHLLAVLDVVHELLSTLLALRFDQDQGFVSLLQFGHRRVTRCAALAFHYHSAQLLLDRDEG